MKKKKNKKSYNVTAYHYDRNREVIDNVYEQMTDEELWSFIGSVIEDKNTLSAKRETLSDGRTQRLIMEFKKKEKGLIIWDDYLE